MTKDTKLEGAVVESRSSRYNNISWCMCMKFSWKKEKLKIINKTESDWQRYTSQPLASTCIHINTTHTIRNSNQAPLNIYHTFYFSWIFNTHQKCINSSVSLQPRDHLQGIFRSKQWKDYLSYRVSVSWGKTLINSLKSSSVNLSSETFLTKENSEEIQELPRVQEIMVLSHKAELRDCPFCRLSSIYFYYQIILYC